MLLDTMEIMTKIIIDVLKLYNKLLEYIRKFYLWLLQKNLTIL